jgi:hypothetical protein
MGCGADQDRRAAAGDGVRKKGNKTITIGQLREIARGLNQNAAMKFLSSIRESDPNQQLTPALIRKFFDAMYSPAFTKSMTDEQLEHWINSLTQLYPLVDRRQMLRPLARRFADDCREILKEAGYENTDAMLIRRQRPAFRTVRVPVLMLASIAEILSTVPGAPGRPAKASTIRAMNLANEIKSNRGASRIVAGETGDDFEKIRANVLSMNKRKKSVRPKNKKNARYKKG